jgi:RNA 2',3'-cyclic 3'-phosphodiesterase
MQLDLGFLEVLPKRPKRPERLFFGVLPGAGAALPFFRFGRDFVSEHSLPGKPLEEERLHISLQHVGDYRRIRSKFEYAARLAGNAVSMPPFEVIFHSIGSFRTRPGRHPLVLLGESKALMELHRLLGAEMAKYGLRAATDFTPHMTLFYGPRILAFRPIAPLRLVVREFVLIHSERGLGRYNILGRWPLLDQAVAA